MVSAVIQAPVQQTMILRGASSDLYDQLFDYHGDPTLMEILLEGPGGSSKTRTIMTVLVGLCEKHPGLRVLVLRATRASLDESFCEPFEETVLPGRFPKIDYKSRRRYAIGKSVIVLGGLDNPSKLYSTNYDVVYIQEAFELSEDEWQQSFRALRNWTPGIKFQLLIGDTNPDSKDHWLNIRFNEEPEPDEDTGAVILRRRLVSRHEDNPKLWMDGTWTPEGATFIAGLSTLIGVRKQRLRYGEWTTAEGAIFPEWTTACVERGLDTRTGMRWYGAGCDWGYRNPGALVVFGVDGDGVCHCVRQVYRTEQQGEFWAEEILRAYRDYKIRFVAADPARPEYLDKANDLLSKEFGRGMPAVVKEAQNEWYAGIETMRMLIAKGKLKFMRESLEITDSRLKLGKQPTRFEEEISGYCYQVDKKGRVGGGREREEIGSVAHAIDATRYFCMMAWSRGTNAVEMPADPSRKPDMFEVNLRKALGARYDDYVNGDVVAGPAGAWKKRRVGV